MRWMQRLRPLDVRVLLSLLVVLLFSNRAYADVLYGIIPERNSAVAAARFQARYPDAQINLRTPRQLSALPDAAIEESLRAADAVVIAGVFGEDSARVTRLVGQLPPGQPLWALSSASTLVDLSKQRFGGAPALWETANAYWQGRGVENLAILFAFALASEEVRATLRRPQAVEPVRLGNLQGNVGAPLIAVFDYETGDEAGNHDLHKVLCGALVERDLACRSIFADWGAASADGLEQLLPLKPAAIVMLQDFAVGGGEKDRANEALKKLNVPVLKVNRLTEFDEQTWQESSEGLPTDSVYYRVAMPELSGSGQPHVVAAAAPPRIDPVSGIEIRVTAPILEEIDDLAERVKRWVVLQETPNADKRLAIIYYNHPPGRHNIGADNLDVPASLFEILTTLRTEGYDVGSLPESPEALLEQIQDRGVNLPENNETLQTLVERGLGWPSESYSDWLASLPDLVRTEMVDGPLSALRIKVDAALNRQEFEAAQSLVNDAVHDMAFVIEGAPARYHERAEALLAQLGEAYEGLIAGQDKADDLDALTKAL